MTRSQIADHEKMPLDHPPTVSKLGSLRSHAHLELEWRDAWGYGVLLKGPRQDSDL